MSRDFVEYINSKEVKQYVREKGVSALVPGGRLCGVAEQRHPSGGAFRALGRKL